MADNFLYDPELNPVIFYDVERTTLPAFQTKHFEYFPFEERSKPWLQVAKHDQVWQTSDIIPLQFESTFDPIIVELIDEDGNTHITLPALIGLPNKDLPNTFSFEVAMSLAGLDDGCYRLKRTLGSGDEQRIQYSGCQHIMSFAEDTLLLQYWNNRFFKDVIFETGIKFQFRVAGWINFDRLSRAVKQEVYRDEKYNSYILSSKSAKNIPVHYGDEVGLPTDVTNLIEQIWECDNVFIDNFSYAQAEGTKIEYTDIDDAYRMRGMKMVVEPGINRNSRVFSVTTDPTKKLITTIIVDARVFGDTANQGNNNTVPVYNFE